MATKSPSAFSLIELLVVISIIGIMAGIALVYLFNAQDQIKKNKNRRNAQQLCLVAKSHIVFGKKYVSNNIQDLIIEINNGTVTNSSNNDNFNFELRNLTAEDISGLSEYITWPHPLGVPVYDPKL
jgi:prepilin-type N-terminal cleavage/methylation domain-containing protein